MTCLKLIGWFNCLNLNKKIEIIENIMEEGLRLVYWEIEEGDGG